MTLSDTCRSFEGKLLSVKPHYGHGWCRLNPNEPRLTYKETAGPSEFTLRVLSFIEVAGELHGAKGMVEQPGHQCNGWFVVFSPRHRGVYDFDVNPPHCNISVGPQLDESPEPKVKGDGALAGFAVVSAPSEHGAQQVLQADRPAFGGPAA